jgi:hypothetical protein
MKAYSGPPMTLGNAARVRVTACGAKECGRQVERDPAKMAARYGAETPVLDWRERLVCSRCGSREVDTVVSRVK